jgi:DNA-binding MarR family transcriptional regulator
MPVMARKGHSVGGSTAFLLGKLGQLASNRFAEALAPLRLRPRHCGVLELLSTGPRPQLDLANALGVAPSVVVDMVDDLQGLDAVTRVRDTADRRRQFVELTETGRGLLRRAVEVSADLDASLLRGLPPDQVTALRAALTTIAAQELTRS